MFWYLFIIVLTVWLTLLRPNGRKIRKVAKQYSSDIPAWPLIGHAHHFIGSAEDRMGAFKTFGLEAVKQGGITPIWLGNYLYMMLADPIAAENILKEYLEKDQNVMRFSRPLLGDGLLFSPVRHTGTFTCLSLPTLQNVASAEKKHRKKLSMNIWRPRRKAATPMFSQKILNSYVQVFAKQSAVMVEQLRPVANGRDFSIWKYATTNMFDSLCETNFNIKMNAQKLDSHPFLDAFEEHCRLCPKRTLQPWLHPDFVYRLLPESKRSKACVEYIHSFIDKIIQDKHQKLAQRNKSDTKLDLIPDEKDGQDMKSFLDLLIDKSNGSNGYNDVQLREELLLTILAGTDAAAVAASFAAVLLSRYTEEQDKVHKEIQEVFGDSDRVVEAEDLPKLKYLELFLKETLRMYPPVPVIPREVNKDFTLPSGKSLVSGMGIALNIWGIHRNHHYWGEDVDQFRPERFLTPLQHPAQFIPFSYGTRNCLGYQYAMTSVKTMIATLVRRYRLLPPAGLPREELHQELRVKYGFMMKHADNFVLRFEPRN